MEPGTLCPKHYTAWRYSPWESFLIFHLLTDGDLVVENYEKQRIARRAIEKVHAQTIEFVATMDEAKEQALLEAMEATGFNIMKATRILKISKATVYRLIQRYGIRITRQIDPKGGFKQ